MRKLCVLAATVMAVGVTSTPAWAAKKPKKGRYVGVTGQTDPQGHHATITFRFTATKVLKNVRVQYVLACAPGGQTISNTLVLNPGKVRGRSGSLTAPETSGPFTFPDNTMGTEKFGVSFSVHFRNKRSMTGTVQAHENVFNAQGAQVATCTMPLTPYAAVRAGG